MSPQTDDSSPDLDFPNRQVNPVSLEVFANLYASIAEEMGTALCRAALSPNIKERRDYSCLICDEAGELVAQAAHIPVHLGSAPLSVQAARSAVEMGPGDVVVLNDPFRGGTHLPDLTMIAPVFLRKGSSRPDFYVANRAHHADVGGMSAGSMPVSDEIFQEGIILPPVRIVKEGELVADVVSIFLANVRTPLEREGDIQAQIGSLRIGIQRLQEIAKRHGPDAMSLYAQALKDHSERMLRSVLASLPDGEYHAEDLLDDDGYSDGHIRLPVTVRIEGSSVEVDFTRCPAQVRGNLNAVEAITLSAVLYVFRLILPQEIPANAGALRPVRVNLTQRSLLNASPPAAVAGGNVETSQRIVDVLLAALAHAMPERIPAASQGTMNNLTIGASNPDPSKAFAYYETIGGGTGGGPHGDGASGVHSHMTNTMNTPVEALESTYPLRVEAYKLRRGSAGTGRFNGGEGIRRDIRILVPADVTILSERRTRGPYGLNGGSPGEPGRNILIRSDGTQSTLKSKATFRAEADDVISIRTPGGGGWGRNE